MLLPPGRYRSGTLLLKSGVELHLARGAVLLGSGDIADYDPEPFARYNRGLPAEKMVRSHLLAAVKAQRVAVTGSGVIDGNGMAFFGEPNPDNRLHRFQIPGQRPCHMVAFYECADVEVKGVTLVNAACYSLAPYACRRVRIEGLTILNHPSTPNGDGIDPDCCQDVVIQGCIIQTADDAIALKSRGLPVAGGNPDPRPCEDIVIGNCILDSHTVALRIGVEGDNPIRRVNASNLCLRGRIGVGLYSIPHRKGGVNTGTPISDINLSQLTCSVTSTPLLLMQNPDTKTPAGIRRVRVDGLSGTGGHGVVCYGTEYRPIEELTLRDLCLRIRHPSKVPSPDGHPIPALAGFGVGVENIPYALYFRYVRAALLERVQIQWENSDAPRSQVFCHHDSEQIALENSPGLHPI